MATVTYIPRKNQNPSAVKQVIKYVMRDDKTEHCKYVSGQNCSPQFAVQEFEMTRMAYRKESPRYFYHYTQSFSPQENVTPEQAHEIAKEFAAKAWPHNEVVIATHIDAEHIHSHFVVNAVCFNSGKMLHQPADTFQKLRDLSDEICIKHCLSVINNPKEQSDGISAREYRSAVKGQSWKFQLMNAVDHCMKRSRSKEEFVRNMQKLGYKVRWEHNRQNITYTTPTGMQCRDSKLHDKKYTKENMELEFKYREKVHDGFERAEQAGLRRGAESKSGNGTIRQRNRTQLESSNSNAGNTQRCDSISTRETGYADDKGNVREISEHAELRNGAVQPTGWEAERQFLEQQLKSGSDNGDRSEINSEFDGTFTEQYEGFNGASTEDYQGFSPQADQTDNDNLYSIGGVVGGAVGLIAEMDNVSDDEVRDYYDWKAKNGDRSSKKKHEDDHGMTMG